MSHRCGHFLVAIAAILGSATFASAATVDYRLTGSVSPPGTVNDFHVKIGIPESAVVGDPINFENGPWGTDGVTTHSGGSFTVDWSGPPISGGGPYDFGFDFTSNMPPTLTEAWWTLNGVQVGPFLGNSFGITEVPEPASLAMLSLGALTLLRRRKPA